MRTRSSSNLPVESPPNPSTSNPKRRNRRHSKQCFILEESPIYTMADQSTMTELLRAPTEGYAEAIVVPSILAEQFELKHSLINMMTSDQFFKPEKENPHDHIHLLRACPHHGFTELHQFDTFYNALNPADQDSLNSAAGGNLLERRTQDVLTIIKNISKVRNSRNKSVVSQVKSSDANSNSSSEIAKLTHAVNQQTSDVTTAMTAILKQFQATPPPASVKVVEEICVTCDGAHPYYQCLAASGNTFPELRDNIQGYVTAAAVNYNQGNFVYRPPGSGSLPSNTIANPKGELKTITTRSGIVLDGPFVPIPPSFINPEEDERVEETLTDQDLAEYTIEVPPPLVQKSKPSSQRNFVLHQRDPPHLNIPYPSRMLKQKQQEKDKVHIHKFWQMFKQLHINITLADALIFIPKYQKMLKALISNKGKLQELANTPLNENCSAIILKKLPEKLGDPGKFLIPCGFNELKCEALTDLGASINLMPLSVWKKLGLPELISTRMNLELANRAICTPARIARDVFVLVGKFTFPADFVIVDYGSDPRVPLILGRPFLWIARALIDVHGEEMILQSINLINVFNDSNEDFLEDLYSTNQPSGNLTFPSHLEITSPEVKDDIFDPEGGNVLPEKLLDLDSTNDLHPPLYVNPLSGSTTYSSSPNQLLEELADELALITFPPGNDDLQFDIESDLKEIEYLLYHDLIKDIDSILKDSIDQSNLANLNDNLVDFMPKMFTDEHALDYSSPPLYDEYDDDIFEVESDTKNVYDDPFDSKGEKIKESKLLIDELDLPCDFLLPSEYGSFFSEDFSEVDALPSANNEDKIFNPDILIQENLFEIITRTAQDKKLAISHASLMHEDFDPPLYELSFFKEVPSKPSSNPTPSTNSSPQGRNRRRSKQRIEEFNIDELSPPIVMMADQHTMAQLLQAPTEVYEDAIVVLAITADNFELKHGLLTLFPNVLNTSIKLMLFPFSLEGAAQIWLEKEPPRSIFTWDDLVSKFINQFFPPSKTTNLHKEITNFQQRFDESFSEAWDRFKDLLRACPHHGFSEFHQLDRFYNALNSKDEDSLNSAIGGNFLDKMPHECLVIFESKSNVHYSRNKPVVAKVSTNTTTFGISPDVVELKDMVKALLLDKKSQNQAPATVKSVEESCVTCSGTHSYRNFPANDGNVYRDNIQEFVSQAFAVNYNQGNTSYHPPMISNQIRPSGFPPVPNNQNVQLNQRNNQNHFFQNQNQGNNFNHGPVYQPSFFQPPTYQAPAYQAPAPQIQGVLKDDFLAYVKYNDVVMRKMQTQGQNMQNQLTNLTDLLTKFVNSNNASTSSSVSAPRPTIPYPTRMQYQKLRDKANDQREKFFQIFTDLNLNISFADALILIPMFGPSIKTLLTNKDKLCELARTPLNEQCSAILLKKLQEKLGDPGKFLIPCDFPGKAECLALADLGARINLMHLSVWNKLSLPDLSHTCMTLELVDRSISPPVGVAKDVYVKVGTFHFPADSVIVDFDADPRVPLLLERSFLKTGRALIGVFEGKLTLRVGKEAITFNLDHTSRYSANYNEMTAKRINVIDMACELYLHEVMGFSDVIASGNPTPYYDLIISTTSSTLTPFENSDFLLEEVDAFLAIEDDSASLEVKLKDLPPYLEYTFLEGDDKLPVIIVKDLSVEEKTALITVLKSHKRAIAWKLFDIKEVLKLLDAGMIYPISYSPWVSPVQCVPKKGGFKVVENEDIELILTRLVTGWRVWIDYRKLNEATRKDHFPLSFMDQMLERLAGNHIPFGLCNAPRMFQRCMMAIFHDMIKKTMKVFMDDFLVFGNSFQSCLSHLERMLKKCEDTNLCLNWEKSHFMVKEGIVLDHIISKQGIEVDKAKVDVITKLPHPITVKDWDMPFELMCDASDFAIGAVLGERQDKHSRPIQYASKTMTEAESNYTIMEKEMLAVVYAFEKFWSYLIMNKSIVYTDHSALKYLFAKKDSKARLLR
nr:reverse transcriptase domain-containing protein [Tanacetum cinerariifolium]